jgi:hypothetical protein
MKLLKITSAHHTLEMPLTFFSITWGVLSYFENSLWWRLRASINKHTYAIISIKYVYTMHYS